MRKILGILLVVVLIVGSLTAYLLYNKPHIDVRGHRVDYEVGVDALLNEFNQDVSLANQKYAGKIILLSGELLSKPEMDQLTIVLKGKNGVANCEMDSLVLETMANLLPGDQLGVKGIFVGYDDLLGELQIKKCVIPE